NASNEGEKCTGINDTAYVWVEPTAKLGVTPKVDTVCNGDAVNILLHSPTVPTRPVRFRYVTEAPAGVTVTPASANPLPNDYTLTNTIVNTTDNAQLVKFIITPYTRNASNEGEKCTGINDTAYVWVEPTATIILNPQLDTICSAENVNISLQSNTVPTMPVLFRYITVHNAGVNVVPGNGTAMSNPNAITDYIENTTNQAQRVLFIITPYNTGANGIEKCPGRADTSIVWVEPVPKVDLTPYLDTICTNLKTDIATYSVTNSLQPVKLMYKTFYNSSQIEINRSQDTINLIPGELLDDVLINHSDIPQRVMYVVYPYLSGYNGSQKCPGMPDTVYVWVAPELKIVIDTISTYIGGNNIRCFGSKDGSIRLAPRGGISAFPGYDDSDLGYTWQSGARQWHSRDLAGLAAANYSIIITDKLACRDDSSFTLTQPAILTNYFKEISKLKSCKAGDGIICMNTHGGIEKYTYVWETLPGDFKRKMSAEKDTLFDIIAGIYQVNITDTNGCSIRRDTIISLPTNTKVTPMSYHTYGFTPDNKQYTIKCKDEYGMLYTVNADTSLTITYHWTCNETGFDTTYTHNKIYDSIDFVPEGLYNLTYEDENGCTGDGFVEMIAPDSIRIDRASLLQYTGGYNVTCYGESNGSITLNNISGGHADQPYQFAWESISGGTVQNPAARNQASLAAGSYGVTITDSYGCTGADTFNLTSPERIVISDEVSLSNAGNYNLNCFGDGTGFIKLTVSGGVSAYHYKWLDNSTTSNERYNLKAGDYEVTVTDALNCKLKDTISLTEPDPLTIDSAGISDFNGYAVRCSGDEDAEIDIRIAGGTPGYAYVWTYNNNPLPDNTALLVNRPAGQYHLNITDANNCTLAWSALLNEPGELQLEVQKTNMNCTGLVAGTAEALVSGGNAPYSYIWSNDSTSAKITGLNPGEYIIGVTDNNSCLISDTVTVSQNTEVGITINIEKPVSCYQSADAVLKAIAEDGVPPYEYNWLNGGSQTDLNQNLAAGIYTVEVTDNDGCEGMATFELVQPDRLKAGFIITDPSCSGGGDGSVELSAEGGNYPYSYYWNSNPVNGETVTDVQKGTYTISVKDNQDCQADTIISVSEPDKLRISLDESNTIYPFCPDWQNGVLSVSVSGGTRDYSYEWDYSDQEHDSIISGLREDTYSVHVKDAMNCETDTIFRLRALHNNCLQLPTAFTPNYDNANDFWEIRYMTEDGSEVKFSQVYPEGSIKIYDRIGNLVFECTGGCPQDWNGEDSHGRQLPVDTYYYIIDLNTADDNPPLKGIVTIIR
ncbi:MAG TPA: gliding motility-associated C-terminal domain-containing protein, partial [Bacteroidales bacterium]|nr:gliding motility-associated C-terminal domain-containing protein [Bacteroidales bacterium]